MRILLCLVLLLLLAATGAVLATAVARYTLPGRSSMRAESAPGLPGEVSPSDRPPVSDAWSPLSATLATGGRKPSVAEVAAVVAPPPTSACASLGKRTAAPPAPALAGHHRVVITDEAVSLAAAAEPQRTAAWNRPRAESHRGDPQDDVSATVTETAATHTIQFLETGAQLRIRPFVSRDGIIGMELHLEQCEAPAGRDEIIGRITPDRVQDPLLRPSLRR